MESYDDVEYQLIHEKKMAKIEESINRAILCNTTGVNPSCKNNCSLLNYILGGSIIVLLIIVVLIMSKIIKI
jgi:hypothetical protein